MEGSRNLSAPGALQTVVEREADLLAPYAMHSADSAGRKHAEREHAYRGPFQRDRDRIVHSAAFRRLSGKMQVFTGEMGDYHRTRMTHTHEVTSIARTLGRALRLNEDLIEALALLHDIGHPPFGHAGEEALHQRLAHEGGFNHNSHALVIVEQLEHRYADFPGLNLTLEVLEGQTARCSQPHDAPPLLEVQVVDAADSIAYDAHDTDDALKLGILTVEEIVELPLLRRIVQRTADRHPRLKGAMLRKALVHELIDLQVNDVLEQSAARLSDAAPGSPDAARRARIEIGPSASLANEKRELEQFLFERVYRHPKLLRIRHEARNQLLALFDCFVGNPRTLPGKAQRRIETVGLYRAVGEYLAGMTDRFCRQQYARHIGISRGYSDDDQEG